MFKNNNNKFYNQNENLLLLDTLYIYIYKCIINKIFIYILCPCLVCSATNNSKLTDEINKIVTCVEEWSSLHSIPINTNKSNILSLGKKQLLINSKLRPVNQCRILGINFQNNLKFDSDKITKAWHYLELLKTHVRHRFWLNAKIRVELYNRYIKPSIL